ncbi:MAG: class II aldolase/adducin family protein [Desulfitobacteriaceae bacterium]|nr:class II aldolase/adducin family protein [Desulfitobacteriaceae bacterium]MDD4345955.1 class II aldolase/adducin family protein [Desulfitobacteriaceae bacterium]MDD4401391.1 class II aldolase/adducin family protein [Desulfitobacteriaceae bacterium]
MSLRKRILAVGRSLLNSGLVVGTWGNISAWDSRREGFWITPSGMNYLNLKPKDLVLINRQGKVIKGIRKPSSESRMHLAIYSGRSDVLGIVHTHSVYATAHAVARIAIPGVTEDFAQMIGGTVEVAPYYIAGTKDLAEAAALALGAKSAVLLANHGVVGVGHDLDEALKVCQVVEKSAQIHVLAHVLGTPVCLGTQDLEKMRRGFLHNYGQQRS